MATIKKAKSGTTTTQTTKKPKLLTVSRTRQVADSLDYEADMKAQASKDRTIGTYVQDYKNAKGYDKISQAMNQSSIKDRDNASRYRKLADQASKKKKMKNGGSLSGLKASNKRVGPVDPKGAFTAVQKKTLAGAKGKASLTKDKQLGATKMAKSGAKMSKK
jgi:hypothetical protein